MLATLVDAPFDQRGWTYEEKYDGIRILAYKQGQHVELLSRNAIDRTASFPGIAAAIRRLQAATLLLDGEAVTFDRKGISRFQFLQQGSGETVFAAFDCLYKDGEDLRPQPLSARRAVLEQTVAASKFLILSHQLSGNGVKAYESAKRKGYEGLVAKDLSSAYVEGRSKAWLKVKVHQEDEFIIVGFTEPSGSRQHLGALLLGAYDGKQLKYVGKVGTGFNVKTLAMLHRKLTPLIRKRSDLVQPPRGRDITLVMPKLVAQISYQEWTEDDKLRQPVFLGLRDDKAASEVTIPRIAV